MSNQVSKVMTGDPLIPGPCRNSSTHLPVQLPDQEGSPEVAWPSPDSNGRWNSGEPCTESSLRIQMRTLTRLSWQLSDICVLCGLLQSSKVAPLSYSYSYFFLSFFLLSSFFFLLSFFLSSSSNAPNIFGHNSGSIGPIRFKFGILPYYTTVLWYQYRFLKFSQSKPDLWPVQIFD